MVGPQIAESALVSPKTLTVDGKPFPFHLEEGSISVHDHGNGLRTLHVGILVDGPVLFTSSDPEE